MKDHITRCPVCGAILKKEHRRYLCQNHHSFDMAKQGYTNVYLHPSQKSGDNKEMVQARTAFLQKGFYEPLREAILEEVRKRHPRVVADAGCGEGYYTNALSVLPDCDIYAFDLSKEALKKAARQGKTIHYFLSSIFSLPLKDASCDIVLNVFAPFAQEEFRRVLKEGGYLFKVDPHKNHLREMKEVLYDTVYENDVFALETEGFVLETYREIQVNMDLGQEDISSLFMMTPYFYKTHPERAAKLKQLSHLHCTASFLLYIYRRK